MTDTAPAPPRRGFEPPGERSTPWLGISLAAGGGILVTIGVTALGADWGSGDDGFNQAPGLLLSAALLALALGVANRLPGASKGAAVAATAGALPVLAGFALLGDENVDHDAFRAFQVVTIIGWLAIFFVGSLRARAVFLGLALALVWLFALGEAAGGQDAVPGLYLAPAPIFGSVDDDVTFDESGNFDESGSFDEPSGFDDYPGQNDRRLPIALVSSVIGIVYLVAVRRLDGTGSPAMATAFAATGGLALAVGVIALGAWLESGAAGGFFAVLAGVFCSWAGAGRRRWTTWFGAALASVGALVIAGDASDDANDGAGSVSWFGGLTIVFGIGLVVAATAIARILHEPGARSTPTPALDVDSAP